MPDLESGAERCESSNLSGATIKIMPYKNKIIQRKMQKKYSRRHYKRNRQKMIDLARMSSDKRRRKRIKYIRKLKVRSGCIDCKQHFVKHPYVLEFDHIKGKKRFGIIVGIVKGYSLKRIKQEIKKCVVRCANCHRIKTHKMRG